MSDVSQRLDRTAQSDGVAERVALGLVSELCRALAADGITYCHWKSNAALERSASGENDLDLLVAPADVQRFQGILAGLGFKEAPGPAGRQVPGIRDHFGLDAGTGRLVHVHAHALLVLGHDATKNYHLPIEEPYLDSATQQGLFRVPAPEFEWVVFVIRMVLKHNTWDAMLIGHGMLSASERAELAYLEANVDTREVRDILSRHLPAVDAALFEDCERSLRAGCSRRSRARVAHQLECSLRAFARRPPTVDVYLKLRHRLVSAVRGRFLHHRPRRRAPGGGMVVAIVGGDGAGKSTAVHGLYTWLDTVFDVRKVHLGKPRWSRLTFVVRALLKLGRSLGLYPFTRVDDLCALYERDAAFPGYPWLIRAVCTARDRYLTYRKAQRWARSGSVVLCDRYPLPGMLLMDGPCLERVTARGPHNAFIRFLARLEKHYYAAITLPTLLNVLRVDPAVAVERKTDEDAPSVRVRSEIVWQCDWGASAAHVIDAGQPREQVLAELRAVIWAQL